MQNNLYQQRPEYSKGKNEPQTVGGLNKAKRLIATQRQKQDIEDVFMGISFKVNRSETQRNERKNKRK